MEDGTDAGVLAVDGVVLDGVDGDAARPDVGRHAEADRPAGGVGPGHEQDVAANLAQLTLVDPVDAHPEGMLVTAPPASAVAEPFDLEQLADVAEILRRQEILERERRREQIPRGEAPPGADDGGRVLLPLAQRGRQLGMKTLSMTRREVARGAGLPTTASKYSGSEPPREMA